MKMFYTACCGSDRKHLDVPYSKPKPVISQPSAPTSNVSQASADQKYIELRPIPNVLKNGVPVPPPRKKHHLKDEEATAEMQSGQNAESRFSVKKHVSPFHKVNIKTKRFDRTLINHEDEAGNVKGKEKSLADIGVKTTTDEKEAPAKASVPLTLMKFGRLTKRSKSQKLDTPKAEIPTEHSRKPERKEKNATAFQEQILSSFKNLNLFSKGKAKHEKAKEKRVKQEIVKQEISNTNACFSSGSQLEKGTEEVKTGAVSRADLDMHIQKKEESSTIVIPVLNGGDMKVDQKVRDESEKHFTQDTDSKLGNGTSFGETVFEKPDEKQEGKSSSVSPRQKPAVLEVKAGTSSFAGNAKTETVSGPENELRPTAKTRHSKIRINSTSFGNKKSTENIVQDALLDIQINILSSRKTFALVYYPITVLRVQCDVWLDGSGKSSADRLVTSETSTTSTTVAAMSKEGEKSGIKENKRASTTGFDEQQCPKGDEQSSYPNALQHAAEDELVLGKVGFGTTCLNENDSRRITNILTTKNMVGDNDRDGFEEYKLNGYQKIEILVKNVGTSSYTVTLSKGDSPRSKLGPARKQSETSTVEINSSHLDNKVHDDMNPSSEKVLAPEMPIESSTTHSSQPQQSKAVKQKDTVNEGSEITRCKDKFKNIHINKGAKSTVVDKEDRGGAFETRMLLFNGEPVLQDVRERADETKPQLEKPPRRVMTSRTVQGPKESTSQEEPKPRPATSQAPFGTSPSEVVSSEDRVTPKRLEVATAENAAVALRKTTSNVEDTIPSFTTTDESPKHPHKCEPPAM
ncbi:unnamed protein product [Soboliphyme baturini]|uniref:AAA domain-containing protein n=1 Tax=Soboliphyme baturini TaxID=241478 RepID=A0A183IC70_9BILA|nr:unnamed protein product [Soboliphyme baturini]